MRRQGRRNETSTSGKYGTFSIALAEASPLHAEFYLSQRNVDEVSWNHLSAEERTQFSKAIETEWQGVLDFKAVTIIDPTQADVIREKRCERVISSRLVLRWKETESGYKAKARWCVHGFKDPDIHEIERSCPTPEVPSTNITIQILASTTSEGTLADGEKAFMQGDPSVREEPLYATPPSEGLLGGARGSTDPPGPRSLRARQRHVRVAITNRRPVERGKLRNERVRTLSFQYRRQEKNYIT